MTQQRVAELSKQILAHDAAYADGVQTISDAEYDKLFAELQMLEKAHPEWVVKDSPTIRTGAKPSDKFQKVKHETRMLSIGNTFEQKGIVDFDQKMLDIARKSSGVSKSSVEYYADPKFDGLALSVRYKNGKLNVAATRGDYDVGENMTDNARFIKSIPQEITYKGDLDVRGEVMMTHADFNAFNELRRAAGEDLYTNPRNAAAGALRQIDPTKTGERNLIFSAYSISDKTLPDTVMTHNQALDFLRESGFPVSDLGRVVNGFAGIQDYFDWISDIRHELPFDIDGVVLKVNNLALQAEAGFISRESRAMKAYKFNQQDGDTVVLGIDTQVGRSGALTPVARLAPITLGGVVVTNATLHNADLLKQKDIRAGDTVKVRRNGDVIPGVIGIDLSKRPADSKPFVMPAACPCCAAPTEKDGATVRCTNGMECPEQAVQYLSFFVSRDCMNIDGVGESLCRTLYEEGLVRTPDQLYDLKWDEIARLPGYGTKSALNTIAAICATKVQDGYRKFFISLGIENAGEGTAKRLGEVYPTIQDVMAASHYDLRKIRDIGDVVAGNIVKYFSNPTNKAIVEKLLSKIEFTKPEEKQVVEGIAGKTFVITGTLPDMSREEAKTWLESMGAAVSGSVSKRTNFLLAGEEAGSKLDRAKEIGVEIIDLDQLRVMAGATSTITPCM